MRRVAVFTLLALDVYKRQAQAGLDSALAGIDQINDSLDDMKNNKDDLNKTMKDLETQMRYTAASLSPVSYTHLPPLSS